MYVYKPCFRRTLTKEKDTMLARMFDNGMLTCSVYTVYCSQHTHTVQFKTFYTTTFAPRIMIVFVKEQTLSCKHDENDIFAITF